MTVVNEASVGSLERLNPSLDNEVDQKPQRRIAPPSGRAGIGALAQAIATGLPLLAADLLSISGATLAASFAWTTDAPPSLAPFILFLSLAFAITCGLFGAYPGTGLHPVLELRLVTLATVLLFTASFAATLVHSGPAPGLLFLGVAGSLSLCMVPAMRSLTRNLLARCSWWGQPVLIFGGGSVGEWTYRYLASHRYLGLRPVGIVDELHRHWEGEGSEPTAYLGPYEAAPAIARRHRVYWGLVAMPDRSPSDVRRVMTDHAHGIPHLLVIPHTAGLPSLWSRSRDCAGLLGIEIKSSLLLPAPRLAKRAMDLALVLVGGVLLLPLLAGIALLIKITSPGPVLYRQQRIGCGDRRFHAWKFRTMVTDADAALARYLADNPELEEEWRRTHKLRNDPRITAVGRWLRKTSLDELPQLWNVLRGEMSLVGPRPIVDAEVAKYDDSFELYAKVRPGITGLWQVSGRNNTTYAERVRLDAYYVSNWSPWLDLYILARTIRVVLRREGAY